MNLENHLKLLSKIAFSLVISLVIFFAQYSHIQAAALLDWNGTASTAFPDYASYDVSNHVIVPVDGADNDMLIQVAVNASGIMEVSYATINETTGAVGSVTTSPYTLDMANVSSNGVYMTYALLTSGDRVIYVTDGLTTDIGIITLDASGVPTAFAMAAADLPLTGSLNAYFKVMTYGGLDYLYFIFDAYFEDNSKYETYIGSCDITTGGDLTTCYELARRDIVSIAPGFSGQSRYTYLRVNDNDFFIGVGGYGTLTDGENYSEFSLNKYFAIKINPDGYIGDLYDMGTINGSSGVLSVELLPIDNDIYLIGGKSYLYTEPGGDETISTFTTTQVIENIAYDSDLETVSASSINTTDQELFPFTLHGYEAKAPTAILKGSDYLVYFDTTDAAESRFELYRGIITPSVASDTTPPVFEFTSPLEGSHEEGDVGATITYTFTVVDSESPVDTVEFKINAGSYTEVTPDSGTYDVDSSFTFTHDLTTADYTDQGETTITFRAVDSEANEATQAYSFTITSDSTKPSISFSTSHTGLVPRTFTFAGTATDASSPIDYIDWYVDGLRADTIGASSGTFGVDTSIGFSQSFSIDGNDKLTEGEHTFGILVYDTVGNFETYNFEIDIDNGLPTCTADWVPLSSPVYGNELTYSNVTCTDNRGVTGANYRIYHSVHGELEATGAISTPTDGVWGETEEEVSFSYEVNPLANYDGGISVTLRTFDEAGNQGSDYDSIVVEYNDDYAPTLTIDPVNPDPNTDENPVLTGSCGDVRPFDTHTAITAIQYRLVDVTGWLDVDPLDGTLDETVEAFSKELTGLAEDDYTIEVRCTDGNSNTATTSDEFTLIPVDEDAEPGTFTHTESFSNHTYQDTNGTTLIWGNGQVRLKEAITLERTVIDESYFGEEYGGETNDYDVKPDLLDTDYLWYSRLGPTDTRGQILEYRISTGTSTLINVSGITGQSIYELRDFQLQVVDGVQYLWITDSYRYFVIRTDTLAGFAGDLSQTMGRITTDPRNRLGAYITTSGAPSGKVNLVYIDLGGDISPTSNDEVAWVDIDASGITSADNQDVRIKPGTNYVYASHYGGKVYKFDDENDPAGIFDDSLPSESFTVDAYTGYNTVYAGMTFDPDGNFIFGTANNSAGVIYVVTNENSTPLDLSDDTIVALNDPIDISFNSIYGLSYLEGENNVGDQLFIETEDGTPYYLNFNSTYTDRYDDTFIKLDMANNWRGRWVKFHIADYDTLYANVEHDGFYRIELTRGWEDSGVAIGVPLRPSQKLVLDNFVVTATEGTAISALPSSQQDQIAVGGHGFLGDLVPQAYAQGSGGISYSISNDNGLTWTPISLGELEQLNPKDYRVKYRIEMTEQGVTTPVLTDYLINFAGYVTETQAENTDTLTASVGTSSVAINTNFSLTVTALDGADFTQTSNNNSLTFTLLNASNGSTVSALNKYSATLSNGTVTVSDMQVSQAGQYQIRVTDGSLTATTGSFTVTGGSSTSSSTSTSPTLSFSANKYTINQGESVILQWNSTHLDTLNLSPLVGDIGTEGTRTVTPDTTTTFTLTGSGDYGDLTSTITITVLPGTGGEIVPIDPSTCELSLSVSPDLDITKGDKATVSWEAAACAQRVYVDYLGTDVSRVGNFELYPTGSTTIVISAYSGDERIEREVFIRVRSGLETLPFVPEIENVIEAVQEQPGALVEVLPLAALLTMAAAATIFILTSLFEMIEARSSKVSLESLVSLLKILGIIPNRKRVGYVFDSRSSRGISFATLTLIAEGKAIATITSDKYGGYYEPFLGTGEYRVVAEQKNHTFPTTQSRPLDLTIFDFYKGEELRIKDDTEQQALIIPMDPKPGYQESWLHRFFSLSKVRLAMHHLFTLMQWTNYPMLFVSGYFLFEHPHPINATVFVFYVLIVVFKLKKLFLRPTVRVKVVDKTSNRAVPHAFVVLEKAGSLAAVEQTNEVGEAEFFVNPGSYSLKLRKSGYAINTPTENRSDLQIRAAKGNPALLISVFKK